MSFDTYEKMQKTVKNVIALRKIILKRDVLWIKMRASNSPWKTTFRYILFLGIKLRSTDEKKNNTHFSLRDDVINRVVLIKLVAKKA
jgi:hypothetical protein